MATTITLNEEQVQRVKAGADEQVEMLSMQELEAVASKLNEHINIPLVSEEQEQVVLVKIVKQIDRFLYTVLPNEVYELVKVAHDGISNEEAELIERRLAQLVNKAVDIPFVSEQVEEKIFQLTLSIIVAAMKKGKCLIERP